MRLTEFLQIPKICHWVFYLRFIYFRVVGFGLLRHENLAGVDLAGLQHNYRALLNRKPSRRILKIIRPLSSIDRLTKKSKILVIGCRFECDLLYLQGYGFDKQNIKAIDLFSYSPRIMLGNMHAMDFPDNSFDAVILGWVLTYSDTPEIAAKEILRVTKNAGIISVGITVEPDKTLKQLEDGGRLIGTTSKFRSSKDILNLFSQNVKHVFFQHDRENQDNAGHSIVIFSLEKTCIL